MEKPIIGITTFCKKEPKKTYCSASYNYIAAIGNAGGIPMLIPLLGKKNSFSRYIDNIDALVLSGGEDISPLLYGENPTKTIKMINPRRDKWELELFNEAYRRNMPILGICRGIQLIDIAAGGNLYQDISVQCKEALGHMPIETEVHHLFHSINIEKESKLFDIFRSTQIDINSYHHQAVKDLAPGFKATARSEEGIIEAIESIDKKFVIGVQWHPEDLIRHHPQFMELFKAIVQAAKDNN